MKTTLTPTLLAIAFAAAGIDANSLLGLRYPFGMPIPSNTGMSFAMGGTSTGVPNDHNLMLRNPANLGLINKTVFSSLILFDFLNISDEKTGAVSNHYAVIPQQVAFGFPLGAAGTIGISMEKRSDATFRSFPAHSIDNVVLGYSRDGNTTNWQAGWGISIGKWAQIGASYERLYLTFRESRYRQGTTIFIDSTFILFNGNGVKAGIMVPVRNKLFLGAYGEYFLEGEARYSNGGYDRMEPLEMQKEKFSLYLPPTVSAGTSYQFNPQWLVGVDGNMTLWDYFPDDTPLLSAPLRDRAFSVSAGGQFIPAPNILTPKYWEIIQYRAGLRFNQLPAASAYEYAFSAGMGLPLPGGGGLLDIVVEYGHRKDAEYTRYDEEFLTIAVGINGGRKWAKSTQGTY